MQRLPKGTKLSKEIRHCQKCGIDTGHLMALFGEEFAWMCGRCFNITQFEGRSYDKQSNTRWQFG